MRLSHDPQVELSKDEITKILARPKDFGYFGDNDQMFETWTLGPVIEHRDSGLIDRSNAEALRRFLAKDPTLTDDYSIAEASHWAVGYVEHLSYRVVDADGKPSRIARIVKAWFAYLADVYPIADEDLHSEMECNATDEWIAQDGPSVAGKLDYVLPEDWQYKVTDWWSNHRSSALECVDDQGASPDEDDYEAAFEALGFAKEE
jgi:hypothetical protein